MKINLLTLDHDQTLVLYPKFNSGIITNGPNNFGLVEKYDFLEALPHFRRLAGSQILQIAVEAELKNYNFREPIFSPGNSKNLI